MKKQNGREKKAKLLLLAAAFLAAALVAGCGGGGSSASAPSIAGAQTAAEELDRDIQYDLDVILTDGRTTGRTAGAYVVPAAGDLLALTDYVNTIPDTAFAYPTTRENRLDTSWKNKLLSTLSRIETTVNAENYTRAARIIEVKLVPRVDGCNGGSPDDDYIADCGQKGVLYQNAQEMLTLMASAPGKAPKSGKSTAREAAAFDFAAFKAELLATVNEMEAFINGLPAGAFAGIVPDPRGVLIGILTVAANHIQDGNFEAAKAELLANFLPLVDGFNGGSLADDLITNSIYQTEVFNKTNDVITAIETTVVRIDVTPGSANLLVGDTVDFSAECVYSDNTSFNCTDTVVWQSSDTSVAAFVLGGMLQANAAGTTAVTANHEGLLSAPVNVAVTSIPIGMLADDFDGTWLNPEKWSDVYNNEAASLSLSGGKLRMTGGTSQYAQIIPTEAFYVAPGEQVVLQADFDLGASTGGFYVQGIGMMVGNTTGLAVGILGGDSYAQPLLYYSSPSAYGRIPAARTARIRVVYKSGLATVYLNNMSTPLTSFSAAIDDRHVVFFLYASASGVGSNYSVAFDNYWTNQNEPGEVGVKIENMTRPFAADGSGGILPGEAIRVTVETSPGNGTVEAGLLNTSSMSYVIPPMSLTETTPGVYVLNTTMPATPVSKVAVAASSDRFTRIKIHTRKVTSLVSAGRVVEKKTGETAPLPGFLLPEELR